MDFTLFFIEFFCAGIVFAVVVVFMAFFFVALSEFMHNIFNKNNNSEDKNK